MDMDAILDYDLGEGQRAGWSRGFRARGGSATVAAASRAVATATPVQSAVGCGLWVLLPLPRLCPAMCDIKSACGI